MCVCVGGGGEIIFYKGPSLNKENVFLNQVTNIFLKRIGFNCKRKNRVKIDGISALLRALKVGGRGGGPMLQGKYHRLYELIFPAIRTIRNTSMLAVRSEKGTTSLYGHSAMEGGKSGCAISATLHHTSPV